MLSLGFRGIYVPGQLFAAHYDKNSITKKDNWQYWKDYIVRKYNL